MSDEKKDVDEQGSVDVKVKEEKEPWQDPGAREGKKKDPRVEQNKLTPDTPRFQDIYKSMKKGEEKIAELEKRIEAGSGNAALVEEMRKHNKSLEDTLIQISGNKESGKADKAIEGLEDKLGKLKELKKEAREKADFDSETDIDEKMDNLRVDIRDAKKAIKDEKKRVDDDSKKAKDPELTDDENVEYKEWIADNPWYTKESKKKTAAIAFEKKIVKEPEFKDSTIPEILEEVKARVEEKFKPVKGVTTVESGGHLSSVQIPGSVKLTPMEIEVAKGLGVSPEKYAKQKALTSMGGN